MSTINGTSGNDTLTGTSSADTINGQSGSDTINGLGGNDSIDGGNFGDIINGGDGNDTIWGDGKTISVSVVGNDTIHGGIGEDVIFGGLGSDDLYGDDGGDTFYSYGVGAASYHGGSGTGADGSDDKIVILPFNGWDGGHPAYSQLQISHLDDIQMIDSESFIPTYILSTSPQTLDLSDVTLVRINAIHGTDQVNDTIIGHIVSSNTTASATSTGIEIDGYGGNDNLTGSDLGDKLDGGVGNDTLIGRAGNDTLIGGAGSDTFHFGGNDGNDVITDFQSDDYVVANSDVTTVNVLTYDDGSHVLQAMLQFDNTFVILQNVDPATVDPSHILHA